jgi:hypothetical protein
MNVFKIEEQIKSKSEEYLLVSNRASKLRLELDYLRDQLESAKKIEFIEYLELEEITITSGFFRHNGIRLKGSSNLIMQNDILLYNGEKFKLIKKNKKSVVIEVVWLKRGLDINPKIQYRIDRDVFYNYYLSDSVREKAFTTYLKRKNALQQILD